MRIPNLVGPPADHVGHQPVDTDGGEKYCEQSEEGGELREQSLVRIGACYLLIQRRYAEDRQVGIDFMDSVQHCSRDGAEVAGVADFKVSEITRTLDLGDVINGRIG